MSMIAIASASSYTLIEGSSPATIRQKMQSVIIGMMAGACR
jgi:hypothetical protein